MRRNGFAALNSILMMKNPSDVQTKILTAIRFFGLASDVPLYIAQKKGNQEKPTMSHRLLLGQRWERAGTERNPSYAFYLHWSDTTRANSAVCR